MDKRKTGNLIKEARMKKNYTQSELGDLIGVSNKAISRWENGESFPDVGILENLATVLDLRIQDIVTGETDQNDENAVVDVVRVATLQQKEKKRRFLKISVFPASILLGMISVISANNSFFAKDPLPAFSIFMLLSMALILIGSRLQNTANPSSTNKLSTFSKVLAVFSVLWSILMTWFMSLSVASGHIPFGMQLSLVGPFMNWQLIILSLCNVFMLVFLTYKLMKQEEAVHWGWYLSMASIYLSAICSDLLHRLSSTQDLLINLAMRTAVVLLITIVFGIVAFIPKQLPKE